MNKYDELANEIIELISGVIEEHYDIEPKNITDDDIENPALINGTIYYDLEQTIGEKIKQQMTFSLEQQKQIKECLESCEGAELERTLREITGVE